MDKTTFRKNLYKALSDEFDTGTKESPFDANNSEFHKPRIDLKIVPKLMEDLDQLINSAVEEKLQEKLNDYDSGSLEYKIIKEMLEKK